MRCGEDGNNMKEEEVSGSKTTCHISSVGGFWFKV